MSDEIAITVDQVSKSFHLPHDRQNSIKGGLVSLFKNGKRTYETQEVLKDVSFEIKKGEFFGIVGRNGSGKSTLLKMLAGIYQPTEGQIHINGSLTPFIELGVGFNPELTGRENVYLNGALLGFSRTEMQNMYNDIVEFAELARFMDQKLKNYSSGMQVRLAFSIAIRAESDILLLDEVLAVGDEAFQRKCYAYFDELKRNKKTVIIVTHDMSAVEKFCDRAILIENGELTKTGNAAVVAHAYSALFSVDPEDAATQQQKNTSAKASEHLGDNSFFIDNIETSNNNPKVFLNPLRITFSTKCVKEVPDTIKVICNIKNKEGHVLLGAEHVSKILSSAKLNDECIVSFVFPNILNKGEYLLDISLHSAKDGVFRDRLVDCAIVKSDLNGKPGYEIITNAGYEEKEN